MIQITKERQLEKRSNINLIGHIRLGLALSNMARSKILSGPSFKNQKKKKKTQPTFCRLGLTGPHEHDQPPAYKFETLVNLVIDFLNMSIWSLNFWYFVKMVIVVKC